MLTSNKAWGSILLILWALCSVAQAQVGYCTYHLYYASESINDVACSDGAHGLGTRWGYKDLSPMYPYVAAWNELSM